MKRFALCFSVLGLLAGIHQAAAMPGPIAAAPAATLLLPYFEVDLDSSNGLTTLFSINNASATAQLAHVTVWSTWSVPVLDFDVYLTGYDVQTLDLRNILAAGLLPRTYPNPNANFPGCNSTPFPPVPPVYSIPALSAAFQVHLQAALTGKASPVTGTCVGRNYGDNIARGYVTVDDVNACSLLFPSSPGYFVNGGLGIAGNDNVLWGDSVYLDPGNNFAQGETLVHIQADANILNSAGEYTFYGRYVSGTAADNREPLPTTFATRYDISGIPFGGTHLIVWRDSKFPPAASCTTGPNFTGLGEKQVAVFDEEENIVDLSPSSYFPDETQRFDVATLPLNAISGWIYLNLNHATTRDPTLGLGYTDIAQAWVETVMDGHGRFSVGYDAIQIDNANTALPGGVVIPP